MSKRVLNEIWEQDFTIVSDSDINNIPKLGNLMVSESETMAKLDYNSIFGKRDNQL